MPDVDLNLVKSLWQKYQLPVHKQNHLQLVGYVAEFLSNRLKTIQPKLNLDQTSLLLAAYLHDLDKNIPWLPGETHPDAAVRVLRGEGLNKVAELVKKHSLYTILDPQLFPQTWEEKILFLADKMVRDQIISVDERFAIWEAEDLSQQEKTILRESYPLAKQLEKEIFTLCRVTPEDLQSLRQKIIVNRKGGK